MTRTSSRECSPTESRRLVRGAGRVFYEYISKLRTEPFIINEVGCDGLLPLSWTDVDGHLTEAGYVNNR